MTVDGATMAAMGCALLRGYLAWMWLQSGLSKVSDPSWMVTGQAVKEYWERAVRIPTPPGRPAIKFSWYRHVLQFLLRQEWQAWAARSLVAANLVTGILLVAGIEVRGAAMLGLLQNMAFSLAGSSGDNPPMLVAETVLVMADPAVSGRIGLLAVVG